MVGLRPIAVLGVAVRNWPDTVMHEFTKGASVG